MGLLMNYQVSLLLGFVGTMLAQELSLILLLGIKDKVLLPVDTYLVLISCLKCAIPYLALVHHLLEVCEPVSLQNSA